MQTIDTHCHLDLELFDTDRKKILSHCHTLGIYKIFIPAIRSATWDKLLQLCDEHRNLYPMLGLHPMFIVQHNEQDLQKLRTYVAQHSPCAIGEIGLDFFIKNNYPEKQMDFFSEQLNIAQQHNLPIVLHVRKAHQQVLKILEQRNVMGGIVHAFSGSIQEAERYIKLGFKLGFGGMLSYSHSRKLRQLAIQLPLTAIVLETDAPDMSGQKHHGQRNRPEYLLECLETLSSLREESIEAIARQTTENANSVFQITRN